MKKFVKLLIVMTLVMATVLLLPLNISAVSYICGTVPGDMNGDGLVNTTDVVILRRFIAGGYEIELIPPTNAKCKHTPVAVAAKEATYTETGMTAGVKCSACDVVMDGCEITPKLGVMVYQQNFDAFADNTDTESVLSAIQWTKLTIEKDGVYSETDAEFAIVDGRLYYDNYDAEPVEGDTRVRGKDGYYQIDMLDNEYMQSVVMGKYTLQYDLEYVDSYNIGRYANIITECSADGQAYNSFHFRIGGYGNNQAHYYDSWKTYDAFDPATDLYVASIAKTAEEAATKGTPISFKLIGKYYNADEPQMFANIPVTIRQQWDPEMGYHVYMKTADMKDFVKISEPSLNADGSNYIGKWEGNAVRFKLGTTIDGYIDNVEIWTGWGEKPEAKHTHITADRHVTRKDICSVAQMYQSYCTICGMTLYESTPDVTFSHMFENGFCTDCGSAENATETYYFNFVLQEDGTYAVQGNAKILPLTEVTVPSVYNGKPVTSIADNAFSGCMNLASIAIPDSVTNIGQQAFANCNKLTSITIPNSVTSIGILAFYSCRSLANVIIPDCVTSIGVAAFSDCSSLVSISIPNGVESISSSAFSDCSSLVTVTIHNSVTKIGSSAFYNCMSLERINLPDSVTSIGSLAFSYCTSLSDIVIPGSVNTISTSAFSGCTNLSSVVISADVKTIGSQAFYNCANLTSITIPTSVETISSQAFHNCANLTSINYAGTKAQWSAISKGSYWDSNTGKYTIIFAPCNNHIEEIDPAVAPTCTATGLTEGKHCSQCDAVLIKQEVVPAKGHDRTEGSCSICGAGVQPTAAEYFTFTLKTDGTYSIKAKDVNNLPAEIVLPDTYNGRAVTSVDNRGFSNARMLTSVTIPNGIVNIGEWAFNSSRNLKKIFIPSSVAKIGIASFYSCAIDQFTVDANNAYYCSLDGDLYNKEKTTLVNYATGKDAAVFRIPEGVERIEYCAFYRASNLETIIIPSSLIYENSAFGRCNNLESFIVDRNNMFFCSLNGDLYNKDATELLYYAGGKTAASFDIPDTVTAIGDSAFRQCSNLTSVMLPDDLMSLGGGAFEDCTGLLSIIIPDSVTTIGSWTFNGCVNLESITILGEVTSIGDYAFNSCSSLKIINYTGTCEKWKNIVKGEYWNSNTPAYTVHCTDGDITK